MIVDVGASDTLGPCSHDSKFLTFITQPAGTLHLVIGQRQSVGAGAQAGRARHNPQTAAR